MSLRCQHTGVVTGAQVHDYAVYKASSVFLSALPRHYLGWSQLLRCWKSFFLGFMGVWGGGAGGWGPARRLRGAGQGGLTEQT